MGDVVVEAGGWGGGVVVGVRYVVVEAPLNGRMCVRELREGVGV